MSPIYNFSAGPGVMPRPVLEQVQSELIDYRGERMSVMEMSHRGKVFTDIRNRAEASLRALMNIPEEYAVLFLQGGASSQFSMVPMNLYRNGKADYLNTGSWTQKAIAEARKYLSVRVIASSEDRKFSYVPDLNGLEVDAEADYVHLCTNNTIYGTRLPGLPEVGSVPLVADMSSNILSQVYRVEDFSLIYAGAQKNMGPAGLTVVIVRKELLGKALPITPIMFDYQTHAAKDSMHNTPPTFAIYLAGMVYDWLLSIGGVAEMERINRLKAGLLYAYLDRSELFESGVKGPERSLMNVPFHLPTPELTTQFIAEAEAEGLKSLKGYRTVGGMRASLYNAMPVEGVEALVEFMTEFEAKAR